MSVPGAVGAAREVEVLVVGAGIAGLAAARDLATAGLRPLVVDAGQRPGGVMQTDEVDGYRMETGPNTFQAKAGFCDFADRHDLWAGLVAASPESRRRALLCGGRLVALPHGPLSALATPLLSPRAKLRALAEPFVRRGDPTSESVYEFVARRLGPEPATRLVGAFLTGVYAGDERRLGIEAVFPGMAALEREHGSLVRGGLARLLRRHAPRGRSGTWSAAEGLGAFAARIAAALPEPPRLETRVQRLAREDAGWWAELSGPDGEERIQAREVLVATPAFAAAGLLESVDPEAAKLLDGIEYAPIVALGLGVDPADVREPIEGFGFIVPRGEGVRLLGCLFMSRLFAGRAPTGRELLHCMQGGVRWREAVDLADDEVVSRTLEDLDRCLGLRGAPRVVGLRRWPRAIPQPDPEHTRRVAEIRRRLEALPGLGLAGSYLAGVSVADTLASGTAAAARILERRRSAAGA